MKINDSIKKPADLATGQTQQRTSQSADKTEPEKTASAQVHLSSKLQDLGPGSVYDAGKVESIKAAIAGGHFQVNPEKIADTLIETVKDLIQQKA